MNTLHRLLIAGLVIVGALVGGASSQASDNLKQSKVRETVYEVRVTGATPFWKHERYPLMPFQKICQILSDRLEDLTVDEINQLALRLLRLSFQYDLDPALILSLIRVESGFQPRIVSYAGAVGLMQIMPATGHYVANHWKIPEFSGKEDLVDPLMNIQIGITYLGFLRDRYENRYAQVLAAYNAGPAKVDQLILENKFVLTKVRSYVESILKGISEMRNYPVQPPSQQPRRTSRKASPDTA